MRKQKDRRTSTTAVQQNEQLDVMFQERRHIRDRRMENMSMEERQLQFSEMPSPNLDKSK